MKPGSLPLAITYIDSDNSSKSPATDSQDTRHEDVLQGTYLLLNINKKNYKK